VRRRRRARRAMTGPVAARVQPQPARDAVAHDIDRAAIGTRRRAHELVAECAVGFFRECFSAVCRPVISGGTRDDDREFRVDDLRQLTDRREWKLLMPIRSMTARRARAAHSRRSVNCRRSSTRNSRSSSRVPPDITGRQTAEKHSRKKPTAHSATSSCARRRVPIAARSMSWATASRAGCGCTRAATGPVMARRARRRRRTRDRLALPALHVDRAGRVHVVWMDDRSGSGAMYHAYSDDTGAHFSPNTRVSDQPFRFPANAPPPPPGTQDGSWVGDYLAVTSAGNRVVVAWSDQRTGAPKSIVQVAVGTRK